ncbi:MAG: oligosaccharide flippase family protein [Candidatus Pacebacteria bacterium]|nr:oligosaccharide flippase family protein [Candidatus Paceibacterota bacterium]
MAGKLSASGINLDIIKKRAVKGVAALAGKTFLLQVISFFGFFYLTVFLDQAEIGLFFAISEVVAILGYFSDIGLAAALIQKKGRLKKIDIQSTFTIQQAIVLLLILTSLILTPRIVRFYNISPAGLWLFRSLLAGFFFASLKTIPSVLLERKLRFDYLVLVELVENLLFYGLSVWLAWRGLGVNAYAWAVLARGLVGAVLIYFLSPWPIGLAFEAASLRRLLHFGVPYQANTVLAVIKDRLMNVFLWKIIGASGVGILGWGQKWAQMPLRFVMDPVMRVTFPAFSRLQRLLGQFKKALEFSLFAISSLAFPLLTGLALLARPLIGMIPKYQKWEAALVPLYLFCFNAFWGAITTPLTNAFNAVGRIKVTFKLMILWTGLTWILTPALAIKFGFLGAAWALGLVPISSLLVFRLAQKEFKIRVFKSISAPLLSSFLMSLYLFFLPCVFPFSGWLHLILAILSGGLIYLFFLFIFARGNFIKGWRMMKNAFDR